MILVSHSYRVRDTRIVPFRTSYRTLPTSHKRCECDMMSEGCDTMYRRVWYDVRTGAIRVSRTRYDCDTRIMPWYSIIIGSWLYHWSYDLMTLGSKICNKLFFKIQFSFLNISKWALWSKVNVTGYDVQWHHCLLITCHRWWMSHFAKGFTSVLLEWFPKLRWSKSIPEHKLPDKLRVINEAVGNARRQWSVVNNLLHTKPDPEPTTAKAEQLLCQNFLQFFMDKVANIASFIQAKLVGSTVDPYTYDQPYNGSTLAHLPAVTTKEVAHILTEMPCKSSLIDFIPTSLLKSCSDFFAPIIARLANLSFAEGQFPTNFKRAQITPLLNPLTAVSRGTARNQLEQCTVSRWYG